MSAYWIFIERDYDNDIMFGPYPTKEAAEHAMGEAPLIDSFCVKDCLDCYTTEEAPGTEDVVTVDLNDPDHTGVGEIDDTCVIRFVDYEIKKGTVASNG